MIFGSFLGDILLFDTKTELESYNIDYHDISHITFIVSKLKRIFNPHPGYTADIF
jgi:hypothetical protein